MNARNWSTHSVGALSLLSPINQLDLLDQIEQLFENHGSQPYEGRREEAVSALAHALQCAQLAEWAHAPLGLVAAALLHDVGHLLAAAEPEGDDVDDAHELRALGLLACDFHADVLEPIRLHVQAKRYLVTVDATYLACLSPASVHSLALQGGAFTADEAAAFCLLPYAEDAIALRRWDDLAKTPGKRTPPLTYYLSLLDTLRDQSMADDRIEINLGKAA